MDIARKVITKLPLEELWNEREMLNARSVSSGLKALEIVQMLQAGATFVVADAGLRPCWIDPAHRFEFWKTEVKSRLAETGEGAFSGEHCYFASKWQFENGLPLIVLERYH